MRRKRSFPLDPVSGREIRDLEQPGYYSGYSTLGQQKKWDRATRRAVAPRAAAEQSSQTTRFFTAEEAELLASVIARVMPQDDRSDRRTIPILPGKRKNGPSQNSRYPEAPGRRRRG